LNRQKYTYPALIYSLIRLTVFLNYPPQPTEEVKQEEPQLLDGEEEQEPEPAPTVQAN